mmetsp:Transcript_111498/g.322312  ORF Transcript_111498/g.322312 Transcript_111498/m.322312 type:complete len:86 (+) Transcript_111498:371-628(+)
MTQWDVVQIDLVQNLRWTCNFSTPGLIQEKLLELLPPILKLHEDVLRWKSYFVFVVLVIHEQEITILLLQNGFHGAPQSESGCLK